MGRRLGGQFQDPGPVLGKRLRDDGQLFEELAYCVPLGIPHSGFLSWSEDDQDKALAYQRELRSRCQGCGTREEDWEKDRDAYITDVKICPGCARTEAEHDNEIAKEKGAKVSLLPHHIAVAKMRAADDRGVTK